MVGFFSALYVGYALIISVTLIPESTAIVIEESNLYILERSDEYSRPGSYFSFFEFLAESLELYGDDSRLHDFYINILTESIEQLGILEALGPILAQYLDFLEWLLDKLDLDYSLKDFIFDVLKIIFRWFFT
jgi:hypothetical protein